MFLLLVLTVGCARAPSQPPAPAAPAAEKPKVESDLSRTTLTPASRRSLGIRSEPIRTQSVQDHLPLAGWIMARQGNEVTLTAPVAGIVGRPTDPHGLPIAGRPARQGQELFRLEPVLTPVDQIQIASFKRSIENEIAKAHESVTVADLELKRVTDLHNQKLRGQQDVEQARARLAHAQADLSAAEDKRKLFAVSPSGEAQLRSLAIEAPRAGTVLTVHVSPGQYVVAAAPLVTIADLSELWVRVPVPEHDLARIDSTHSGTITLKPTEAGPGKENGARFEARPVAFVPQVDPVRHTADLIYELVPYSREFQLRAALRTITATADPFTVGPVPQVSIQPPLPRTFFAKDQMLMVQVPLGERRSECVVPYSAVVFDAYAGAWIYIDRTQADSKEHVYERRRVELGPTVGNDVVITPPAKPGERVVTSGAAALLSREFHKTPVVAGSPTEMVDDDD